MLTPDLLVCAGLLQINPRSSVLRCHLGMALAKMNKKGEALAYLEQAIQADPSNPLARFERAGVLLSEDRFAESLAELEALRVRPLTHGLTFH